MRHARAARTEVMHDERRHIHIAREAGDDVEHTLPSDLDFLERFASFVAAVEREKCAAIMDDFFSQNIASMPRRYWI